MLSLEEAGNTLVDSVSELLAGEEPEGPRASPMSWFSVASAGAQLASLPSPSQIHIPVGHGLG